ncbi:MULTISPECIES: alpha/beta fold hydrolase [unclassified Arthrobacter]|uniref:alpha/beta fold hydrolase n=1 Tax=unclassified Arthrobacter TaxID=235627 RepID=UPI000CE53F7B|nr:MULTISPECIES: alpha/beta hydrolase [unclassified Arthrobacter]
MAWRNLARVRGGRGALKAHPVLLDDAQRLDAQLGEINWAMPPAGSVDRPFSAPSGTLAMRTMGAPADPPVVLVPGAMGSKEDFSLMMPILAAAGYYVISFDLAGQYESAGAGPENLTPPQSHYEYDLFVNDVLTVLDSLSGPAHVLGYSFAGIVSQIALTRRPDLFRSLCLLSCPPVPGQSFRTVSRVGRFSPLVNDKMQAGLIVWGIRKNFVGVPASRMDFISHRFDYTRNDSLRDIVGLMKRSPDLRAALKAAPQPKLVAVGRADVWPQYLHYSFAESIGARFAAYGAGHGPCEDAPHQLSRDLLALYASAG